jgi:RHS repeat-associated protein
MDDQLQVWLAGRLVKQSDWVKAGDRLGSVVASTNDGREKYATYRRDATGLDYAWNRMYSSTYGRFLQADPYRASASMTNPQSWNRYAYVENDPVNRLDPSGLYVVWPAVLWTPEGPPTVKCCIFGFYMTGTECEWVQSRAVFYASQGNSIKLPGSSSEVLVKNLSKSGENQGMIENTLRWLDAALAEDTDCAGWLEGARDYIGDLLGASLIAHGHVVNRSSIAAFTGTGNTDVPPGYAAMVVNDEGAFFRSGFSVANGSISGGTELARVFILLHELAHGVTAKDFENDYNSRPAGNRNDARVLSNCKKTLDRVR